MNWISLKQRFKIEDNRVVGANLKDNKNWIEVHIQRIYKEIMKRVWEILVLEDNRYLTCYLIVFVPKKKNIISRLEI